jgi:hypothetical protein
MPRGYWSRSRRTRDGQVAQHHQRTAEIINARRRSAPRHHRRRSI